jgi:mono/diheme cytochrome c family protein
MKFAKLRMFSLIGAFVSISAGAWAQDQDSADLGNRAVIGKKEYQAHCTLCHGIDGKGRGAYKESLKVAPADLTTLTKKNNGVFPLDRVYKTIDGREAVAAHGPREMPIWGTELVIRAPGDPIGGANDQDGNSYARSRIFAIIDYLLLIQEK